MTRRHSDRSRDSYHHGDLRESLIQAALVLIAERGLAGFAVAELARAVGVSSAAPYRHFRDRDAVIAEVARRGFDGLAAAMRVALASAGGNSVMGLERCAQAHLAFAGRERPVYATMFNPAFPITAHPTMAAARDAAFAVLRHAAETACMLSRTPRRPPPSMIALHIWSLTHGIADLFVGEERQSPLAMSPEELLEAGLLIYLQALDIQPR